MLALFGLSTDVTISLALSGLIDLFSSVSGINTNRMLQTHADPPMRGRVISLHSLTIMGMVPLGVMREGVMGSVIGVVIVAGLASLGTAAATIMLSPKARALA